jgi:hypothetical protein
MLKRLGVLTVMFLGTAAFLQPVSAYAQSPYDRGYYSYNDRGYRNDYYGPNRDYNRQEWREGERREQKWRERRWREQEWRAHERWENRNGYYNNRYYNPYYGSPY